jgi:hypothetical protein
MLCCETCTLTGRRRFSHGPTARLPLCAAAGRTSSHARLCHVPTSGRVDLGLKRGVERLEPPRHVLQLFALFSTSSRSRSRTPSEGRREESTGRNRSWERPDDETSGNVRACRPGRQRVPVASCGVDTSRRRCPKGTPDDNHSQFATVQATFGAERQQPDSGSDRHEAPIIARKLPAVIQKDAGGSAARGKRNEQLCDENPERQLAAS